MRWILFTYYCTLWYSVFIRHVRIFFRTPAFCNVIHLPVFSVSIGSAATPSHPSPCTRILWMAPKYICRISVLLMCFFCVQMHFGILLPFPNACGWILNIWYNSITCTVFIAIYTRLVFCYQQHAFASTQTFGLYIHQFTFGSLCLRMTTWVCQLMLIWSIPYYIINMECFILLS